MNGARRRSRNFSRAPVHVKMSTTVPETNAFARRGSWAVGVALGALTTANLISAARQKKSRDPGRLRRFR